MSNKLAVNMRKQFWAYSSSSNILAYKIHCIVFQIKLH